MTDKLSNDVRITDRKSRATQIKLSADRLDKDSLINYLDNAFIKIVQIYDFDIYFSGGVSSNAMAGALITAGARAIMIAVGSFLKNVFPALTITQDATSDFERDELQLSLNCIIISCYAMRNADFHRVVGTKRHTLKNSGGGRVIANKNKILSLYEGGNGVKTGFTKKAGRCLVSSAYRNGMEVVCAVLNCGDMWNECMAKMDLAFQEYSMREIMPVYSARIATPSAKESFARAETLYGFSYPMKAGEPDDITVKIRLPQTLAAPLPSGSEIGGIEIYLKERLLNSQKIYTINDIEPLTLWDYLNRILKEW